MKVYITRILNYVRGSLLKIINKEFLIFLVFLGISAGFWVVMALNETYEREIGVPVDVVNVPDNIIITDSISDTIRVTVKDKGYALLSYYSGETIEPIHLQFEKYAKHNGKGNITVAELQKLVYPMLYASTKITAIKAERLEFYYNYGLSKRVPVLLDGQIRPAESYHIAEMTFSPDSVTVFASKAMLDSITEVFTEELVLEDFTDTISRELSIRKIRGAKISPNRVKVSLYPDLLTEMNINVPITPVNTPEGLILRTFPSSVNVKVVVGRSKMAAVKPENFSISADYNDVAKHPTEKCNLSILVMPKGITSASLETQQVDYLIERVSEHP